MLKKLHLLGYDVVEWIDSSFTSTTVRILDERDFCNGQRGQVERANRTVWRSSGDWLEGN